MLKSIVRKISSVLLSVILLLCAIPMVGSAEANVDDSVSTESMLSEYTFDNIPQSIMAQLAQPEETEPDTNNTNASTYSIDRSAENNENLQAKTPVDLATDSAEDMTSLTVVNQDGSKSLHRFFKDIKFVDRDGKIRFKDNALYESDTRRTLFDTYAFENGTNDIKTYYPEQIKNGLKLEKDALAFSMKPIYNGSDNTTAVLAETVSGEDCVEYQNAFGAGTALQYVSTDNGIKENLVLNEHPGRYSFSFEIDVGDLQPTAMSGTSIIFVDPQTNEEAASVSPIDMQDSYTENGARKPHISLDNVIQLEATDETGIYTLTMLLDRAFLDDPSTVYPVIVDPSVSVPVYNATSKTVYSSGVSAMNVNIVGKTANFGTAYTYIKTDSMGQYTYINTNNITSAHYRAYEHSGNASGGYIEAYTTWFTTPTSEVTYAMCQDAIDSYYYDGRVHTSITNQWVNIPITNLVINWIDAETTDYIGSEDYGFILRYTNTTTGAEKNFYPPGSSTYAPTIVINYTEDTSAQDGLYYIKNAMTGKYLDVTSPKTTYNDLTINVIVWAFHGAPNQMWEIEYQGDGWYHLKSKYDFPNAMYLDRSSSNADVCRLSDSDTLKFRLVQNLNGSYRIFSKTGGGTDVLDVNNRASSEDYHKNVGFYEYHGGDNQNWILEPAEFTANVNDYYDNGMLTRWDMTNAQMQGNSGIAYYQEYATTFFEHLFDIELTFSTPQKFTSFADDCGYSSISALDSTCSHAAGHKTTDNMREDFHNVHARTPRQINILWTGHTTNTNKNNVGYHNGYNKDTMLANNWNLHQGSFIMMQNIGNNGGAPTHTFTSTNMRAHRTYLHELCHAFGAYDSYCSKDFDSTGQCSNEICAECRSESGYAEDCIMAGKQHDDLGAITPSNMETWLCDKCKSDISDYILRYYHQDH